RADAVTVGAVENCCANAFDLRHAATLAPAAPLVSGGARAATLEWLVLVWGRNHARLRHHLVGPHAHREAVGRAGVVLGHGPRRGRGLGRPRAGPRGAPAGRLPGHPPRAAGG